MSEQELLDQIQKLAGAINRHKDLSNRSETNRASSPSIYKITDPAPAPAYRGRGHPSARRPYQRIPLTAYITTASRGSHPYSRGRAAAPVSRHRTLIVNQKPPQNGAPDTAGSSGTGQWIQKRDRHMQLINASVYEERAQQRQNEILETSKQRVLDRQARRDKVERQKLYSFLKRKGEGNKVSVCGILYRVVAQGNKLEKYQDNATGVTPPRRIKVGGVGFYRSKNGNYWRRGAVTASKQQKSSLINGKLTPRSFKEKDTKKDKLCRYFTKTGSCAKGQSCRYIHDPEKLALCPLYLKDTCPLTSHQCPLSHVADAYRSPACLHFNRGHCDKGDQCRYAHVKTNPCAPICKDFALLGYCARGNECEMRHVFECPEFTETGECHRRGCKLPHIDTATTVRKRTEQEATRKRYHDDVDEEDSEEEDESSGDEEEEDTESDVESEGVVDDDDGERFEDQLDFMHL